MSEQTNILKAIRNVVREEIRPFRDEIKKDIADFKNEILTHIDGVMKEIKIVREEQPIMSHTLVDHEKRIDRLETTAYAK